MALDSILAFLAGVISIVSPCVVLVLPSVFAGSVGGLRKGFFVVAGMMLSFTLLGLLSGAVGAGLQWLGPVLTYMAYGIIILFGLVMVSKRLNEKFTLAVSRLIPRYTPASTYTGRFLLGISLGIIWIPCTGPVLGSILAYIVQKGDMIQGGLLLFLYSLGLAISMAVALIAGRKLGSVAGIARYGDKLRIIAGWVLIVIGIIYVTGLYTRIQSFLFYFFPEPPL